MTKNPLSIISTNDNTPPKNQLPSRRQETQAIFERLWNLDPNQFNPMRNCMEQERIARTINLINDHLPLSNATVADLGCGDGVLTLKARNEGAKVDAVDIAQIALKKLHNEERITTHQDYVPRTSLDDDTYDLVIATEIIAYLPHDEYRLFFSELARLVKSDGYIVCSTPLDMYTEDPLQHLADLAETELEIIKWHLSYHRFYINFRNFFEAPHRFLRAYRDRDYRQRQLDKRTGFSHHWFRFNSTTIPAFCWWPIQWVTRPIANSIRHSRNLLLGLEKICRFLWSDSGITHALFIAKRRPIEFTPKDERPVEHKHKKQVWE